MAKSGSTSVTVTAYDTLKFSWEIKSQSITNNTSTVTWKMELVATSYGYINATATCPWAVTVNGVEYSGSVNVGIGNNETKTLASGTTTITHGSDGTKTFSYSFEQYFGITFSGKWITTISGSGSGTLNTIARTSQPSCITWPEHTQNVGYFGDTISIHTNRKNSSLTHTLRYQFGTTSGTIATGVGTGTTWTIPLTLMNLLPSATSGSGTIYCDTYSGSTKVGTASCGFTATVPSSVKPSCSITLDDTTGVDEIYGSPVQGLSKIKVTVKTTPAYSSPIASYTIEANGATYSGAEATTGVLQNSGSSKVNVTVRDKRGRTGSASYTMSVQAYTAPAVSKLNIKRCDANGTENDKGAYIQITFSAAISSLDSKNTTAYALRYKKSTDAEYTTIKFSNLTDEYAVTDYTYIFAADPDYSYDIEVTATDRHATATRGTSGSTAFTLMDWKASGTGIAFGKVAEKDNTMEIALNTEIHGSAVIRGNRSCFSTPGTAGSAGYILMARIAITAANADTPITFVLSRRQAETTMAVYVQFRNSTATTSTLQSIRYEGSNYGAFLVPTGALTWDLYVQKGSAYDTVTIQDWYTSKTMESRVEVTFPGTLVSAVPTPYYRATPAPMQSLVDYIYPVGSIYLSYNHTNPADLFGGTWARIQNRFLWAVDASGEIGLTGGEKEVTLEGKHMPEHGHGPTYTQMAATKNYAWYTASGTSLGYDTIIAGEGAAHNNMPPYIQVSAWRRTA